MLCEYEKCVSNIKGEKECSFMFINHLDQKIDHSDRCPLLRRKGLRTGPPKYETSKKKK